MRAVVTTILAAILCSLCATGQDFGEIKSLGLGRSRLRCTVVERRAVPVEKEGRILTGRIPFREVWLQRHLPRLFPALETVDVVDRVLARTGPAGAAATIERILEVVGPRSDVEAAAAVVQRILSQPDRRLSFRLWAAVVRFPAKTLRPTSPRVHMLNEKELDQQLEELAADESAIVFQSGTLDLLNGQSAAVSVGSRISYVKDYRLSKGQRGFVLEPVVDTIQEGLIWSMGAVHDSGADKLHLSPDFRFVQVARPVLQLRGRVEADGQELVIEKPIVAETHWQADDIICAPGHRGFVVTGIRLRDINGLALKSQKAEIMLLARFDIERLDQTLSGKVQGYDRAARLAFVQVSPPGVVEVGRELQFERDGRQVARGQVTEILGHMVTVDILEGEVKAGDTIR